MAQKYYHSGLSGAPALNGTAGSLIAVLDAVIKDGWGLATATSVVVSGGVATATFASAHASDVDITVRVAGASPSGLNGDKVVTAKAGNTISWATTEADGTATGTITVKIAPLDWTKPFSGTNTAAYQSSDPTATACLLRVDDTGSTTARVVGFESMTDVNSGSGQFPTSLQFSGGLHWRKSSSASATAIPWEIVGDETGFYFISAPQVAANSGYLGRNISWFGDINAFKSGDAYKCVLVGSNGATDTVGGHVGFTPQVANTATFPSYAPRSYTQIGSSVQGVHSAPLGFGASNSSSASLSGSGDSSNLAYYPNSADASLRLVPIFYIEAGTATVSAATLRGTFPGVYSSLVVIPGATFAPRDMIVATGDMAGKKLLACPCSAGALALSAQTGCTFIDIKGAWR